MEQHEATPSLLRFAAPLRVDAPAAPPAREDAAAAATAITSRAPSATNPPADLLHCILNPREWEDAHGKWIEFVDLTPPSREDVAWLQATLDRELRDRQARPTPVCPVREELFSATFDELIRQVYLEAPERGLMLARVRDQLRLSLASYQSVYMGSLTLAAHHAVQSEASVAGLQRQVTVLEEHKRGLQDRVLELRARAQTMERHAALMAQQHRQALAEQKALLEAQINYLEVFLNANMDSDGGIVLDDGTVPTGERERASPTT